MTATRIGRVATLAVAALIWVLAASALWRTKGPAGLPLPRPEPRAVVGAAAVPGGVGLGRVLRLWWALRTGAEVVDRGSGDPARSRRATAVRGTVRAADRNALDSLAAAGRRRRAARVARACRPPGRSRSAGSPSDHCGERVRNRNRFQQQRLH